MGTAERLPDPLGPEGHAFRPTILDVNDRIRLGGDSYERTVAHPKPPRGPRPGAPPFRLIEVCCTVTHHNQAHLYETAEIAEALGVDHFKLRFQFLLDRYAPHPLSQGAMTEREQRSPPPGKERRRASRPAGSRRSCVSTDYPRGTGPFPGIAVSAASSSNRIRPWITVLGVTVLLPMPGYAQEPTMDQSPTIRLEAEAGQLTAASIASDRPGFQGDGYVTGLTQDASAIRLGGTILQAGIYDLAVRYHADQDKGCDLTVIAADGSRQGFSGTLTASGPGWARLVLGKTELPAGSVTVELRKGWGWYEVDGIDLSPSARLPLPAAAPGIPVDPQATAATKALLTDLVRLGQETTLTGTYSVEEAEHVRQVTGHRVAVRGYDLMDYSPSRIVHGANPAGETERVIQQLKASGQWVTISWHWNAPTDLPDRMLQRDDKEIDARWWRGFYTEATTFDLEQALADPAGERYQLLLRDIDAIAVELKKFAAAGIPVLWRPLHEADGRWFWWGAKGPGPCKALWKILYDRLTTHHGLHQLLWVWTEGRDTDWYPGDGLVDVVGTDQYPKDWRDPLVGVWSELVARFGGRKPIALTEFGGLPDLTRMDRFGVRFAFAVAWPGKDWLPSRSDAELTLIVQPPAAGGVEALTVRR